MALFKDPPSQKHLYRNNVTVNKANEWAKSIMWLQTKQMNELSPLLSAQAASSIPKCSAA